MGNLGVSDSLSTFIIIILIVAAGLVIIIFNVKLVEWAKGSFCSFLRLGIVNAVTGGQFVIRLCGG